MNRLQLSSVGNPYEFAKQTYKASKYYNETDWLSEARAGRLDQYINALQKAESIDKSTMDEIYNHSYSNEKTRLAALYNEIYANKTILKDRERTKLNPDGSVALDSNGKEIIEKYQATDYDYNKELIKENNEYNKLKYELEAEKDRKAALPTWEKIAATIVSVPLDAVMGAANTIDNLVSGFGAITEATNKSIKENKSWFDAYTELVGKDTNRPLQELEDTFLDLERHYSWLREVDGNYSDWGKYVGGVAYTLGQMAPTMLVRFIPGLNLLPNAATGVFYTAATFGNIREEYKSFTYQGKNMPGGYIMLNAGIKSVLQWGVEKLLDKFIGVSAFDKTVFGREVSKGANIENILLKDTTKKSLTKAGWARLFKDTTKEGLEEVLQDTSDHIVDGITYLFMQEDFGSLKELTFTNLMDSFIIGGLASFAGSAMQIVGQTLSKDGPTYAIKNADGEYEFKKLSPIAAWEYGLDMESFLNNYNTLIALGKDLNVVERIDTVTEVKKDGTEKVKASTKLTSKATKQYQTAFKEMYLAYRLISSVYNTIGEARFKAANDVLAKLSQNIKEGKFDQEAVTNSINLMMGSLKGYQKIQDKISTKQIVKKLLEAQMTKAKAEFQNEEEIAKSNISQESKETLAKVISDAKRIQDSKNRKGTVPSKVNNIVVTEDGTHIVLDPQTETAFIPEKKVKGKTDADIYQDIAQQYFIESISESSFYKSKISKEILDLYKIYAGSENITNETAIYALIYDTKFFKIVLSSANKEMLQFISSIREIERKVVPEDLRTREYKTTLQKAYTNMKLALFEYCISQQYIAPENISLFGKEDIEKIKQARWNIDLANNWVNNPYKLSNTDWEHLKNKIRQAPGISPEVASEYIVKMEAGTKADRLSILYDLNERYKGLFLSRYDGVRYMQNTSIPNRIFNCFLENGGLTLQTLISEDALTNNDKNNITELYGSITKENIIKYRQSQFETATSNYYTFKYNYKGKIGIFETKTQQLVGYNFYIASLYTANYMGELDITDKTYTSATRSGKNMSILQKIMNNNLDIATKISLTINDVVNDASLLDSKIVEGIKAGYDVVNPVTTFLYLREYIAKQYNTKSLTVDEDGDVVFANIEPMYKTVIDTNFQVTKDTRISDIIDNRYLSGRLKDIQIVVDPKMPKGVAALYSPYTNTIKIRETITSDDTYGKFTFLHEFQHAIQAQDHLIQGTSPRIFSTFNVPKNQQLEILADVKKHVPELFENISTKGKSGEAAELRIAERFLYNATGEYLANGYAANYELGFYPLVISSKNNESITITTPWGSSYSFSLGMASSKTDINILPFESTNNFTIINYNNDYDKYSQILDKHITDSSIEALNNRDVTNLIVDSNGNIKTVNPDTKFSTIISEITHFKLDLKGIDYLDTIARVTFESNEFDVFIPTSITQKTLDNLKNIMDYIIDTGLHFNMVSTDGSYMLGSENFTNLNTNIALTAFNANRAGITNDNLNGIDGIESYTVERLSPRQYGEEFDVDQKPTKAKDKRMYVGQKKSKGTNFEKYGYTKKYGRTRVDENIYNFINRATDKIDKELWNTITDGKFNKSYAMNYFRNTFDMNQATFDLYNDVFFHNKYITSNEELERYVLIYSPEYYAANAVLRHAGMSLDAKDISDPGLMATIKQTIENRKDLKSDYDRIVRDYSTAGIHRESSPRKGAVVDVSREKLRQTWMEYFDGSLITGAHAAAIGKYLAYMDYQVSTSDKKGIRLESTVRNDKGDKDMTVMESIKSDAIDGMQYVISNMSKNDKISALREHMLKVIAMEVLKDENISANRKMIVTTQRLQSYIDKFDESSPVELDKEYARVVEHMSEKELNAWVTKTITTNMSNEAIINEQVNDFANDVATRTSYNSISNMKASIRTIKSKLANSQGIISDRKRTRILKEYGDILDENLNLKSDIYRTPTNDPKHPYTYKDLTELTPIEERISQLREDVKLRAYDTDKNYKALQQIRKEIEKQNQILKESLRPKKNEYKTVTIELTNNEVTINAGKPVPPVLQQILNTEFTKLAKSKTQFYTNDTSEHIAANFTMFMESNAETLSALTQSDVDAIIDFYENSEVIPSTNNRTKYLATEIWVLTYIDSTEIAHNFTLTDAQREVIKNRIEPLVSTSGMVPNMFHYGIKMLKPQEIVNAALAKATGITFTTEENAKLAKAVLSKDANIIAQAKEEVYNSVISRYKGKSQSILDKLLRLEQMFMLSSPGTWVRNWVSNLVVTGTDKAAETVGSAATKVLNKLFPKTGKITGQYTLIGTKVTSEVETFVNDYIIKTNLMGLIFEQDTKYDTRKFKTNSALVNMAQMIQTQIQRKIFNSSTFKSEHLQKLSNFIFDRMSDNKFVNKRFLSYLGKMLTEEMQWDVEKNGTSDLLSDGLSNRIQSIVVDAYTAAAADFMHKPNFWNSVEENIKHKLGNKAYFAYKQILPFMSASWNWFLEGLKFTPFGLAKSIINYAKLENTIARMDKNIQHGEKTVSSKFAKYIAIKDIGKGVLGTIATGIGLLLGLSGVADIDDRDDEVKLRVGNVYININDIFGTQGIFMGMAYVSYYKKYVNNGKNWWSSFINSTADTLNNMFLDDSVGDLYNTLRGVMAGDAKRLWFIPDKVIQMFIPNMLKWLSKSLYPYKTQYSKNPIVKSVEKIITNIVPWALPKYRDPYTGEAQVTYGSPFWTVILQLFNKTSPIKVNPFTVTDMEKEALSLGVRKQSLPGSYTINDKKVQLGSVDTEKLNVKYGQLNKKALSDLRNNKTSYKVNGKELYYNEMTDEEKATIINRIMTNNSNYAKIYILTETGKYKYYTSQNEYNKLKELGITKNVYIQANKNELVGFKPI